MLESNQLNHAKNLSEFRAPIDHYIYRGGAIGNYPRVEREGREGKAEGHKKRVPKKGTRPYTYMGHQVYEGTCGARTCLLPTGKFAAINSSQFL